MYSLTTVKEWEIKESRAESLHHDDDYQHPAALRAAVAPGVFSTTVATYRSRESRKDSWTVNDDDSNEFSLPL